MLCKLASTRRNGGFTKPVLLLAAAACATPLIASFAQAAITVNGYYRLGEADPGATLGGSGASTTVDSSGNGNDLTLFGDTPTYVAAPATATLNTGSTLALSFDGANSFYRGTRPSSATDNIGLEGYFTPAALKAGGGQSNLALLGNGGGDGVGLCINGGTYKIFFPGQGYDDTGVTAVPGVPVYFAFVRSGGNDFFYLNSNTSNAIGTTSFGNGSTGFDIGSDGDTYTGSADEVRVFTFAAGAFDPTTDLLIDQTVVPEPASLGIVALGAIGLLARRRPR